MISPEPLPLINDFLVVTLHMVPRHIIYYNLFESNRSPRA